MRIRCWISGSPNERQAYWRSEPWSWGGDVQMSPAAIHQYQRVGLLPLGDTPRAFWQWWYHANLVTKQRWFNEWGGFDSEIGWAQYLERLAEGRTDGRGGRRSRQAGLGGVSADAQRRDARADHRRPCE